MQLTPEAHAAIDRADELLHVVADEVARTWLGELHPNARSLTPLYGSGGTRTEIYSRMADEIVAAARPGRRICAAFYGNAGVFGRPAHLAVRRARAEGIPRRCCRDLGAGLPGRRPRRRPRRPRVAQLRRHRLSRPPPADRRGLRPRAVADRGRGRDRRDRAPAVPPPRPRGGTARRGARRGARGRTYEASPYPVVEAIVDRVRVADLAAAPMTVLATLYVPPSAEPSVDAATVERLGMASSS